MAKCQKSSKGRCERKVLRIPDLEQSKAERVTGTLRRECLDHVIVFGETHLRRIVRRYVNCHHRARTHLALDKGAPEPRSVQPADTGAVIEIPEVGGLHHRHERRAA